MIRQVVDGDVHSQRLMFVCPACALHGSGIHMLTVNEPNSWTWDGNLEAPTLSPSIASHGAAVDGVWVADWLCHSYLEAGLFRFLSDSTHAMAGQVGVPMPDLPEWTQRESDEPGLVGLDDESDGGGEAPDGSPLPLFLPTCGGYP